ncbi:hypothetical protein F5Y15DRAFT_62487 [Xylariaceae sp. FL0016]|nr:hypothetical protein F5Y15DRAFT_62487 [Xylariaceae sp. FL0016]
MAPRLWHTTFRDVFSHPRLWMFPLGAGFFWFMTLTILLIRWLALGRPRYPGQVNPYMPFISDIAAQTFKPIFIVGCCATGACFFGTMFAVHHVRYSPRFYGLTDDAPWRQAVSMIALVAGLAAAINLVFLSIFDTYEETVKHRYLLMGTFCGLFISAVTTTLVWWDQTRGPRVFVGLRKWCLFNLFLVLCQFCIGVAFVTLMYLDRFMASGVLEWTLTYLGSFWLLSFVGYTMFRDGEEAKIEDLEHRVDERQPLLA